jgi:hypothetical protein
MIGSLLEQRSRCGCVLLTNEQSNAADGAVRDSSPCQRLHVVSDCLKTSATTGNDRNNLSNHHASALSLRRRAAVGGLDAAKLRLAFVVYGGTSRKDWRTVSLDEVTVDAAEADAMLLPLLRGNQTPVRSDLARWTKALIADCHELLAMVLPLTDREREFLERLNGKGEILPEVLTDDERLRDIVRAHPGLLWKALNVQKFRGTSTHGTSPESDLV